MTIKKTDTAKVKTAIKPPTKTLIRQKQAEVKKIISDRIVKEIEAREWRYKDLYNRMKKKTPCGAVRWFTGKHNFSLASLIEFEMAMGISLLSDEITSQKSKNPARLRKITITPIVDLEKRAFGRKNIEARKLIASQIAELFKANQWDKKFLAKLVPGSGVTEFKAWTEGKSDYKIDILVQIELCMGFQMFADFATTVKK